MIAKISIAVLVCCVLSGCFTITGTSANLALLHWGDTHVVIDTEGVSSTSENAPDFSLPPVAEPGESGETSEQPVTSSIRARGDDPLSDQIETMKRATAAGMMDPQPGNDWANRRAVMRQP